MTVPNQQLSQSRSVSLDLIRALAVMCVPAAHFFLHTEFYNVPLVGFSIIVQTFLRMSFMMCVPLFLMLTGYLQINKQLHKGYYKKLLPILAVYLIYALLSILVRILYFQEDRSLLEWAGSILDFSAIGYAWYINMYIGLFLLIPFLNILYQHLETRRSKQVLILSLLFLTALPDLFTGMFPDYWASIYPLTYYFMGSYIREYRPKMKPMVCSSLFLLIVGLEVLIEVWSAGGAEFLGTVGYISSIFITLQALFFFLLFYEFKIENHVWRKGITLISILSLDIYLASYLGDMFVYRAFYNFFAGNQAEALLYFVPVTLTIFILSLLLAAVRYKLIRIR